MTVPDSLTERLLCNHFYKRKARPIRGPSDPVQEASWREVSQVLDEELRQLSDTYRAPLVLCYLEGLTREQAAAALAWSLRTVERRLERGRALLRGRLERRGLGRAAVLLAGSLMPKATSDAACLVPVLQIARAGGTNISARVLSLADVAVKGMAVGRGSWILAMLVAASALAAGASLVARRSLSPRTPNQPALAVEPNGGATGPVQKVHLDRYGEPLPKGAIMRLGTVRFCQPQPGSLVFSPDGKFLASGGEDSCIRLWDPATGREVRVLKGHHNAVNSLGLSADGKWLASGSQDGGLYLWDVGTGKIRRRFVVNDAPAGCVALSPNGNVLASSGHAGTLRLWDTRTRQEIRVFPGRLGWGVDCGIFSPDSQCLAFSRIGTPIQLVEVATGKRLRQFSGHMDHVLALAFIPDGRPLMMNTRILNNAGSNFAVRAR